MLPNTISLRLYIILLLYIPTALTLKISVFFRKSVLIYRNPYFIVLRLKSKGERAVSAERLPALSKWTVIPKTCAMNSDARQWPHVHNQRVGTSFWRCWKRFARIGLMTFTIKLRNNLRNSMFDIFTERCYVRRFVSCKNIFYKITR
jgi:hypothetical protein